MPKQARQKCEAGEPMTLEQAKQARKGQILYSRYDHNADGTPVRRKVTSVKTWKTRPAEVRLNAQYGMYEHCSFSEYDLHMLSTEQREVPCK